MIALAGYFRHIRGILARRTAIRFAVGYRTATRWMFALLA
jgi:hypothetical protein